MDQHIGTTRPATLTLEVGDAPPEDVALGTVRIDPVHFAALDVQIGDIVGLRGKRETYAKVTKTYTADRGRGLIQMDQTLRENCGAALGDVVAVRPALAGDALEVVLHPRGDRLGSESSVKADLPMLVRGRVVAAGDRLRVVKNGSAPLELIVHRTAPDGPVVVRETTRLELERAPAEQLGGNVAYADIGGLGPQLQRIREVVELPLKHPEAFARLGIDAPKGVLLWGPPGTGKTLIARAVAQETSAHFLYISGPEIFHKFYGESEAHLREVFQEAVAKAPSIVFLDEMDAIASKREDVYGEVEKRVVAQLMTVLDGLDGRGQVIVIAATNRPNALDPALRRPGRFDREVHVPVPSEAGRLEILQVHTRRMPLAADVALIELAQISHGFVGADLASWCREAAMAALRRLLTGPDSACGETIKREIAALQVDRACFIETFKSVKPSVMREEMADWNKASWSDIGGLKDAKRRLEESILWPLRHPALFKQVGVIPATGTLLTGPPGSGKTLLASAIGTEAGVNVIRVNGASLLSKWVGESERNVRDVFQKARLAAPCIVYFEELDAVAPARRADGDSGVTERVVGELITQLDEARSVTGIFVVATTSRIDLIEPGLLRPGRLDVVELPAPARDERLEILRLHSRERPLSPDVDLDVLADLTEELYGGDLALICRRAALLAIGGYLDSGKESASSHGCVIRPDHFRKALDEIRRSAKARLLERVLARGGNAAPADSRPEVSPGGAGPVSPASRKGRKTRKTTGDTP